MMHLRRQLHERKVRCAVLNIGASRRDSIPEAIPVRSGLDFIAAIARHARRGYHIHHFFNLEGYKAVLLAVAAAITARASGGSYSIGFIGGPRQKYLTRRHSVWTRLCRVPVRLADFLICNNDLVKDALSPVRTDRTRVHTIECFCAEQISLTGELPKRVRAFMRVHTPVLSAITHPRLETENPHHELQTLICAMGTVRNTHQDIGCVVIGGSNAVPSYERMVEEAGLESLFCFAGELPHEECLTIIKHSDVFVRAYVKDGSSSSVREALALAVPTVASANPQHPDAIMPFAPSDGDSLSRTLLDVLTRLGELRQQLEQAPPVRPASIERELSLLVKPRT
jgi:glycosyltransferase involved in cell wall biosynthesis